MSVSDPKSLNEVIHGRTRLKILTVLSGVSSIEFVVLRDQLGITDGALSVAVKKLEDSGLVKSRKTHELGRSKTTITLTGRGGKEFDRYLDQLRSIIDKVPARK